MATSIDLVALGGALLGIGGAATEGLFVITNGLAAAGVAAAALGVSATVFGVLGPAVFCFAIPGSILGLLSALGVTLKI